LGKAQQKQTRTKFDNDLNKPFDQKQQKNGLVKRRLKMTAQVHRCLHFTQQHEKFAAILYHFTSKIPIYNMYSMVNLENMSACELAAHSSFLGTAPWEIKETSTISTSNFKPVFNQWSMALQSAK
jgi:hypothetical protein